MVSLCFVFAKTKHTKQKSPRKMSLFFVTSCIAVCCIRCFFRMEKFGPHNFHSENKIKCDKEEGEEKIKCSLKSNV